MKKIVYLLTVVGLLFIGCNPIEDINNAIDAQDNPIIGSADYTLTDEDYEELDLGFGSFSSIDDAKTMLPPFLADKYPFWGEGSAVNVGYNLYQGSAEGVSDFTGSDIYQLTNSDYASAGSDAFGFYPNTNATSKIPDVLASQIASPTEGQVVLAKYKQYFEDPIVGLANIVDYNFAGSFEGWSIAEESGADDVWTSETGYVQGNGYFGGQFANEEWLVSPSIDLSSDDNLKFQITHELDYAGDASLLKILVSTDYAGDVLTATWDEITLANPATGDMAPSEDYDFSAYDGMTINVAFKYESTDSDAGRWRVSNMAIKTLGATGDTNSKGEYFMYSGGTWEAVDGVYFLSSADFDSMGEGSGQPGQYNNFSSSVRPENYLPAFMGITFPYGQEEDELFIIYDYYSSSSGAQRRGNQYTVVEGVWDGYESTIATTLQFGHDGNTWVPDNTIRYTFSGLDVAFISDAFITIYPGPADNVGFYGSFDRRTSSSNYWSDEMLLEAFNALLENGNFVTDEEQKYVLTYIIYNGATTDESMSLIKLDGVWVNQ